MSRLHYFASASPLEERPNPYVRFLSVNEALALGYLRDQLEAMPELEAWNVWLGGEPDAPRILRCRAEELNSERLKELYMGSAHCQCLIVTR